ncbi:MAG: hypothetical protein QOC76_718 [Mycobacterium sp.]|nr:hypothetical protein [Mycobacterium sp.]
MQTGDAIDVIAQVRPEIETHLVPVMLAWNRVSSVKDKAIAEVARADVESVREAFLKAGFTRANEVLKELAGFAIPGLGGMVSGGITGYRWLKNRRELKEAERSEVDLGADVLVRRASLSHEVAALIVGAAHTELPAIVVVEDIHFMSTTVGDLLDAVSGQGPKRPVLVVATAWPESREAPIYAQWRESALAGGRAEIHHMPSLTEGELREIVLAYAPQTATDVATLAVRRHPNPLALEAILGSPLVERAIATNGGALPIEAINVYPQSLEGIYRDRFREQPADRQFALAIAAGALPETAPAQLWPFLRTVVADAVERCPDIANQRDATLQGLEAASSTGAWLVDDGDGDRFREALQVQVANHHLVQEILLPDAHRAFRNAATTALADWIDTARGDRLIVDTSEKSLLVSRWLLEMPPIGAQRPFTFLAAAYEVAEQLAHSYQYSQAAQLLTPYIEAGTEHGADVSNEDFLEMRATQADWFGDAGLFKDATARFRELVNESARVRNLDDPDVLALRRRLILWLAESDELQSADAVKESDELLADCRRALGADHETTLSTRHDRACWLCNTGDFREAANELQEVLNDFERQADGLKDADQGAASRREHKILTARQNLADVLGRAGRFDEAVAQFQQVLSDYERVQGRASDWNSLMVRGKLAATLGKSGRVDEALRMFDDVVSEQIRLMGTAHPYTLKTRQLRFELTTMSGGIDEALAELPGLVADETHVLGPDHRATLATRRLMGLALALSGEVDEALSQLGLVADDCIKYLGTQHDATHAVQRLIGDIQKERNFFSSSGQILKMLADSARTQGHDHLSTLELRHELAYRYYIIGLQREAVLQWKYLLADCETALGHQHDLTRFVVAFLEHWQESSFGVLETYKARLW